jgi:pentapeptide MXKDX repeat protein
MLCVICAGFDGTENGCFHYFGRLFQQETQMKNLLVAACCAALVGSTSIAFAQTTGPTTQDTLKTNNPMNANAKMKKKHTKKSTKSDDGMKGDMTKDGTKKDTK